MVFRLRGERFLPTRQAHKRVDTKVSTLLRITHFLRGHGADCRHVTAAKQGSGRGVFLPRRRTACAHVSAYSQCRIPFYYTDQLLYAGATYPCRATCLRVVPEGTCELGVWYNVSSQALSITPRSRIAQHGYAAPALTKPPV